MADYVAVQFEAEPFNIEQAVYDYLQTVFPEWSPKNAGLATILTEAFAQEVAELMRLATDVPPEIWLYYGRLVGIVPDAAVPATGYTTWTMIDNAGYTIPAGTTLRLLIGGDEYAAFETVDDVVVPNGDLATPAGAVQIRALEDGTRSSGLETTPELINILDYVDSIAITGPTTGGVDEEDIDTYLDRLARRLQLMADRPILPRDFEIYTTSVFTGIARALAIDGYNPVGGTYGNEKMIAIAALDTDGNPIDAPTKDAVKAQLEAVREVNFVVNMIDPTFTALVIDVTVRAYEGFSAAQIIENVQAAVNLFLNPLQFGQPDYGDAPVEWLRDDTVRYLDIAAVVRDRSDGVNYIEDLAVNGGVVDVALAGVAPLPDADPTINVTVTFP
jgi:hypothetical protein